MLLCFFKFTMPSTSSSSSSTTKRKAEISLMKGQTKAERQEIRREQRDVKDFMMEHKNEIGRVDSSKFAEARAANNRLGDKVRFMREEVLDADNLNMLSRHTTTQAKHLAVVTQAVTVETFTRELRKKMVTFQSEEAHSDEEFFDWPLLGGKVGHLFGGVAHTDFLNGPVGKPPPLRKERKKRADQDTEEEAGGITKSEEVKEHTVEQKEQTQVRISEQLQLLRKVVPSSSASESGVTEGVDFFNFVVNPASFTQTVENVFDLSFLVKQGTAALQLDDDGLPVVLPCEHAKTDDDQKSTQLVVALSPKDIRDAIDSFKCNTKAAEDVRVPHRDEPHYQQSY